jgi:ATP-dependent RNA helicase HelY
LSAASMLAPVGSMTLPKRVEHRQPRVRRDLASALRSAAAGLPTPARRRTSDSRTSDGCAGESGADPELVVLREQLRRHPAHREPGREAQIRMAERYLRIERDNATLQKKVAAATNSLARTFDRIVGLLTERGFIRATDDAERSDEEEGRYDRATDDAERSDEEEGRYDHATDGELEVTDDGRLLARIYSESDLLVAECLRTGAWTGLRPAELAAVLSAVLYESRGGDGPGSPQNAEMPTPRLRQALRRTRSLSGELRTDEQRHRITLSREPDDGFVMAIYRWASSGDLAGALAAADAQVQSGGTASSLSAGDFVRWCRQVLDLLDQVRNVAPQPSLRVAAKHAIDAIRRSVVAVDAG